MFDELTFGDVGRILADPGCDDALAVLLKADPPWPITETCFLQREPVSGPATGSSLSVLCRVFYRQIDEDGEERTEMATLGRYLTLVLGALVREQGWYSQTRSLLAAAHRLSRAERKLTGGREETLNTWAMSDAIGLPLIATSPASQ